MSVTNNTIKKEKNQYKHITKEDRYVIKALYDQKDSNGKRIYSNADIARYLGVHRSTISRELKRVKHKIYVKTGRIKTMPYNAEYAWENYLFKRGLYKGKYKLRKYKTMAKFIEDKIKKGKWSPDVIVGYMKTHHYFEKEGFCKISTPTIYNAIRYHIIDVKLEDTRRMKYKPVYAFYGVFLI